MNDTSAQQNAARKARVLLDADVERRVQAIRDLTSAAHTAEQATTAHKQAWKNAVAAGWSEKELRAIGAPKPGTTRTRLPRRPPKPAENGVGNEHP